MKQLLYAILGFFAVSLVWTAERKHTITSYFYVLMDDYMVDGLKTFAQRSEAMARKAGNDETIGLIVRDDRNGYLALGYKTRQQSARHEFAIWRLPGGDPVVGVNALYSGVGGTTGQTRFYTTVPIKNTFTWKDSTDEIFGAFQKTAFHPKAGAPTGCPNEPPLADFPENFSCKLPQKGLTVVCQFNLNCETPNKLKAADFYAKPVVKFVWKKDRFVAQ